MNSRLIVTNFSPPGGKPSTGIVSAGKEGVLHVDFEDCEMMGYKVFGSQIVNYNPLGNNLSFSLKGKVRAYIQYQQVVPNGMENFGGWPVDLFNVIGKFRIN